MSLYCSVETIMQNQEALILALMETGNWTRQQIEVYQEAQRLYGYHNDLRPEKAHIIIHRRFIGSASNDIGFVKDENGQYKAIISEYDSNSKGYNQAWINRLKGNYAYHTIRLDQERRGRMVSREKLENGKQRITIGGYR